MPVPRANVRPIRLLYFVIGLIATFAYRAIIVLEPLSSVWTRVAWYVGTVGFILYFVHRFAISERRAKAIREYDLERKVAALEGLGPEERQAMGYLFATLRSSKERWNYIFIFVMSGLALVIGIILDLGGR